MDPLPLLKDLVAIPSVNPMGLDVSGDQYFEGRVTAYLENFFDRLGVTHEKVEVLPERHNLLARFDGEVLERDTHVVVRTPRSPSFWWGNFVLFPEAPRAGEHPRRGSAIPDRCCSQ